MKPKLLTTLQGYTGRLFVGDLFAGISVALVAIPLSIAIAIASGAPPEAGLVTAIARASGARTSTPPRNSQRGAVCAPGMSARRT